MHVALAAIIFIIVLTFAVVFVGGSIVVTVGRLLFRALGGGSTQPARPRSATGNVVYCSRAGCNTDNPVRARFCRRCGEPLQRNGAFGSRRVA